MTSLIAHKNLECYARVVSVPCSIKGIKGKSLLKFCLSEAFRNIGRNVLAPYNSIIVGVTLDSRLVNLLYFQCLVAYKVKYTVHVHILVMKPP